ncbi:MAG: hypothetical protein ACFFF4_17700 [Candidatus Thorarchaeota archaeon]
MKDLEVYLTIIGGNIGYVKEGSEFTDLITTPTPFPFLLPMAVVISIFTLVILDTLGKKLIITDKPVLSSFTGRAND